MCEFHFHKRSFGRKGSIISACIVVGALISAGLVVCEVVVYPRTDDAEVTANFIGMAPVVEGPVVRLPIHDNDLVKKGRSAIQNRRSTLLVCFAERDLLLKRSSKAKLRMSPVESPLRSTASMWRTQVSKARWRMRPGRPMKSRSRKRRLTRSEGCTQASGGRRKLRDRQFSSYRAAPCERLRDRGRCP